MRHTVAVVIVLPLLGACDFSAEYRSPYGAAVLLGDNVAELAEAVGPIAILGTFFTNQEESGGPILGADASVAELCNDDDNGALLVRTNQVWFEPYVPAVAAFGNQGTTGGGTNGPWLEWATLEPAERRAEVDVRIDRNAPCSIEYELALRVVPLSEDFAREDRPPPDPFRCGQEDIVWGGMQAIAEGPTVVMDDGCLSPFDTRSRVTLSTDDGLTDLPDGYPPGAPRPDHLRGAPTTENP